MRVLVEIVLTLFVGVASCVGGAAAWCAMRSNDQPPTASAPSNLGVHVVPAFTLDGRP